MKSNKRILTFIILITLVATAALLGACLDFSAPINKINLSFDSEIILENSVFAYTGEEITPNVTVKHREEIVDAQNFSLSYSNNSEPGIATVTAEGKGNYYGSVSAAFVIGYQYTFNVNGADKVDGEVVQTVVEKNMIKPPAVEKKGYDFLHWSIDSQPFDFSDNESLPSSGEFVANYVLKTYFVTYHLDGGTNDPANREQYTVEDYFTLEKADLQGRQFAGWYLDSEHKTRIISLEGFAEDLQLYAKFVDYTAMTIEYRVPADAEQAPIDYYMPEEDIYELNSQRAQIKEIDGTLKKLVWYADENYSTRYFFREMPNFNLIVYAQWEEVLQAGFLDRVEEFSSNNISIDSFEELVDYVDYVCFNNIVSRLSNNMPIDVDYIKISYVTRRDDIKAEIDKALVAATYPRMAPISYAYQDGEFKMALTKDVTAEEASISATKKEDFVQIKNIFALQSNGRAGDYDKFPIDFVEKTYEVETSNQLFYVLSHGYRPLPKSGSKAEEIYDWFRKIMSSICDDNMSDLEKARAIYEWIIINVQYDNAVADPEAGSLASDPNSTYLFDAFYLEGVLNGLAVCDGISKAYSVMCAIEGIDCVRVTGDNADGGSGHAWNKVRIGGDWYLTDATWGNAQSKDKTTEYLSYQYFLFTDADRAGDGYINQNYTYYVANSEFDEQAYYSSRKIEINSYTADFYIDSDEELSYLLDYIDVNFDGSQLAGFSFEIIISPNAIITNKPSGDDHSQSSNVLYSAMVILRARRGRFDQPKISISGIVEYGENNIIYIFSDN